MLDIKKLLTKILDVFNTTSTTLTGSYNLKAVAYRRCGIVTINIWQTAIANISKGTWITIGTLPQAYRPLHQLDTLGVENNTSSVQNNSIQLRITTDGDVKVWAYTNGVTSNQLLSTVTFMGGGYLTSKFYEIFSHLAERWCGYVRFKGVISEDIKRSIQSCRTYRLLSTCKFQCNDTSRWFNALYQITRRSLCGFLYSRCKNDANTNGLGCSKDSGEQSCIGIYKSILLYIKRWWHIQILLWKQPRVLAQCYRCLERKYRLSSWRCSTNVRYGRYNIATISERRCVAC